MAAKKTTTKLGVYVSEIKNLHGEYYHVRAHIVTIGHNAWERRCINSGEYAYPDIKYDTIRNAGRDTENGLYLDSLTIDCQGTNSDRPRKVYAFDTSYRDHGAIDATAARKMAATLTTIDKRTAKMAEQYGQPATFGAYVARVAQAIGASAMVVKVGASRGWSYNDSEHRQMTIADGIYHIDRLIHAWERETETAEQATA